MFVFGLLYITLCPFSFAIILKRKREQVHFAFVLRMSCYCLCAVALPHVTVGWLVCNV